MSNPPSASQGEPLQIGCRMQMLLLATFASLFVAACWLIGTMMANPS
jgi:hypothetical protein